MSTTAWIAPMAWTTSTPSLRGLFEHCSVDVRQDEVVMEFPLSADHLISVGVLQVGPIPDLLPPGRLDGAAQRLREVLRNVAVPPLLAEFNGRREPA
jgi:hypothetical protein